MSQRDFWLKVGHPGTWSTELTLYRAGINFEVLFNTLKPSLIWIFGTNSVKGNPLQAQVADSATFWSLV